MFIFCRTTYLHQVYFADNSVVTIVSNSPVHLLRSLITVGWGKHISSHAAQKTKSHRHFLQTGNYSFPKHHFWMHHGWNNVREPLYGYRCSFDCLETFSTASAMCTYMSLIFFGFGFWLQRQKRYQTLLFLLVQYFFISFFSSIVLTLKAKQLSIVRKDEKMRRSKRGVKWVTKINMWLPEQRLATKAFLFPEELFCPWTLKSSLAV